MSGKFWFTTSIQYQTSLPLFSVCQNSLVVWVETPWGLVWKRCELSYTIDTIELNYWHILSPVVNSRLHHTSFQIYETLLFLKFYQNMLSRFWDNRPSTAYFHIFDRQIQLRKFLQTFHANNIHVEWIISSSWQ